MRHRAPRRHTPDVRHFAAARQSEERRRAFHVSGLIRATDFEVSFQAFHRTILALDLYFA